MTRRKSLKVEVKKTGEREVREKEKATVIEKGEALTETASHRTETENRRIKIANIWTRIGNRPKKTANCLKRTRREADRATKKDLGRSQGGVRLVEVENPQIVKLQEKGLTARAGGVMESRGDQGLGQRNAQDQGPKDVPRDRQRDHGQKKVGTGHDLVLRNFWMPLAGLTDQKRPKSG